MKEIEFRISRDCDLTRARRIIEQICEERGLQSAMKGSLAKYPGSTHWHYKKPRQSGTLELTLYVPDRRIWAQVQKSRAAPWIDVELPQLRRDIEAALRAGSREKDRC
jgi:hypothetical protein